MTRLHKHSHHLPHYLPLLGMFALGVIGFSIFSFDKYLQAAIAISAAVGYVTWGMVHHLIHGELSLDIFLEYLTISLLGLILIFSVIFGA